MKESLSLNPTKWQEDLTFNTYVPITCDDVLHLHSYNDTLTYYGLPLTATGIDQYFFGNHPIKRVQVAGKVVYTEYREHVALSLFSIVDGFGNSPLQCVIKSNPLLAKDRPVEKGQLVVVLGKVSSFGGEIQVQVIQLMCFSPSDVLRYYVFREEAVLVRKYVLERSADEFKGAVRAFSSPVVLTTLNIAELSALYRTITAKARSWGLSLDNLLTNPQFQWP